MDKILEKLKNNEMTLIAVNTEILPEIPEHITKNMYSLDADKYLKKEYKKPIYFTDFSYEQLLEIADGLLNNIDISKYAKTCYDEDQMAMIKEGIISNIDISIYANPKFNWLQMREIKEGLENNLDVSSYANENYDFEDMEEIKEKLLKEPSL